jgi:malonyl-CoA O-methyltransferase
MSNLKLKISDNFSRASDSYDVSAMMQKQIVENLVAHSREYITPASRIIDIGSGTGFTAQLLQRQILQADISLGMCKKSAQHSPSICADFEDLPFRDFSFDAVYSTSSLQWIENHEKAIAEAYRVLDKKGYFCFTTFGEATLKELKNSQDFLNIRSKLNKFFCQDDLQISLKKAGFQVIFYDREQTLQHYNSTRELLRSIKNIGANTSFSSERSLTKENLIRLEDHYKNHYRKENSLYSTWEVLYFICQK